MEKSSIEIEKNEPTITNAGNEVKERKDLPFPDLDELIFSSKEKAKKDVEIKSGGAATTSDNKPPKAKIQRVPYVLRDEKKLKKHYEPKWISIGPIHHGQQNLRLADRYKLKFTEQFLKSCRYSSCESLYNLIKDDIETLKKRFDDEVINTYKNGHSDPDEALARMLFVDGCFMLHFIDCIANCKPDIFELKHDQIAFVLQDLFLLENQIPFEVLQKLIDDSRRKEPLKKSIGLFLRMNVMAPPKYEGTLDFDMNTILAMQPVHLLDLLRIALLHKPEQPARKPSLLQGLKNKFRTGPRLPVTNEQNQSKSRNGHTNQSKSSKNANDSDEQQFFRSISDLKAAGINLKPSTIRGLKDSVNFSVGFFTAELELPPVKVDDSTEPKFLNMIAFEMCPDNFKTQYEITSYISFLDSLIDYPNDVKELRSAHILHNFLGCDEEVAKVFNKIGRFLVPNPDVYKKVTLQIEKHYQNRCMTWIAQVINDHFSTPWTIVAFLAGFLALALTVIQTWYTIDPPGGP